VSPYQTNKRFCSRACQGKAKQLDGPGAKLKRRDGYIAVYYPTHPDASKRGMILEHRLVVEATIGRRLLKTEHVHHINGIKDDNRPENLTLIDPATHAGVTNRAAAKKRVGLRAELEEYRRRFGPIPES
jgi:hypothetical protein